MELRLGLRARRVDLPGHGRRCGRRRHSGCLEPGYRMGFAAEAVAAPVEPNDGGDAGRETAGGEHRRMQTSVAPAPLCQPEGPLEIVVVCQARILIAEARSFPDLAQVWHDEVVAKMLGILTTVIAKAQARGEVREGDPRLHAFSIIGPVMAGVLFREIFRDTDADLPNLEDLAAQHAQTIIQGLRASV